MHSGASTPHLETIRAESCAFRDLTPRYGDCFGTSSRLREAPSQRQCAHRIYKGQTVGQTTSRCRLGRWCCVSHIARSAAWIWLAVGLALTTPVHGQQPTPPRERPLNPLEELNTEASRARQDGPQGVRTLVDFIFDRFAGFQVPSTSSLRTRVFNADLDYRLGKHPPITEGQLVRAVNQAADRLFAPPWAKTSVDQIHILRTATHPLLPQLVGMESNGHKPFGISERMSPAEAVFVSFFLMGGKMWDNAYRVPPDDWVARIRADQTFRAEGGHASPPPADSGAHDTIVPPGVINFIDAVNAGLPSDDSVASREANTFLSNLGIRR